MTRFLPPMDLIRDEVAHLARTAQAAGDTAHANAFNRASEQLAKGVLPFLDCGDLLVPSKAGDGTVYRVTALGCSCTAGVNGRFCWHAAVWEGVALAWDTLGKQDAGDVDDAGDCEPEPTPPAAPALRLVTFDPDDDAAYAAMLAGLPRAA